VKKNKINNINRQ